MSLNITLYTVTSVFHKLEEGFLGNKIGIFLITKNTAKLGTPKECITFQQIVLGQLDIHMEKNEVGHLPHSTYKKLTQNGSKT